MDAESCEEKQKESTNKTLHRSFVCETEQFVIDQIQTSS